MVKKKDRLKQPVLVILELCVLTCDGDLFNHDAVAGEYTHQVVARGKAAEV